MSWLQFFGLHNIGWWPVYVIAVFVGFATMAILDWKFDIRRKIHEANLSYFAFIPLIGRRFRRYAVDDEITNAKKGTQYAPDAMKIEDRRSAFMEFIRDMPLYEIDDDFMSRTIRSYLGGGGANYQQVVLHDSSSLDDVMIWVRKDGNYFIHNKGLYLIPWDIQKTILHWDIQDCRPMEDKSPQAKWENPKMNARYFWGVVNSVAMNKDDGKTDMKTMIMLIALGIILCAVLYTAYSTGKAADAQMKVLIEIANNTARH